MWLHGKYPKYIDRHVLKLKFYRIKEHFIGQKCDRKINKTKTGNLGCIFQGIVVPDRLDLVKVSIIQSTS